jgi:glycerol-3-phosphate acyltransferase PlsX
VALAISAIGKDTRVKIAVDAIGGDHGGEVVVPGALAGARQAGVGLILTGPEATVQQALGATDAAGVDITVLDAPEIIAMDDHPAQAVRRKPNSSIVVAMNAVKRGEAAAMVSAGNSGAVMAAGLMVLGRIPGVDRPALAGFIPTRSGSCLLLDLGAVTDPSPQNLVQFAQMGSLYVERARGIARPTVGLLSNGEEASKGNQLVRDTSPCCKRRRA